MHSLQHRTDCLLYAVINNAGVPYAGAFEWDDIESMHRVFTVNCSGYLRIAKKFLPLLRQCKSRLVNIGSLASRMNGPYMCAYNISKVRVQ